MIPDVFTTEASDCQGLNISGVNGRFVFWYPEARRTSAPEFSPEFRGPCDWNRAHNGQFLELITR